MAEMQSEGVDPATLEALDVGEHAAHWQRSLAFIRIVARYFEADSLPDPAARQRRVVEALAERWVLSPPAHPVIIAGSTGSRGATQRFMQAVAALPQGMVVLPGFDFEQPESLWDALTAGPVPAEDHPQYRFVALAGLLGLAPSQIARWRETREPSPARNRLVALALRPAPVTDQWMRDGAGLGDLIAATEGLSLIEAPDPRSEALAIALMLREAAERGTTAALVTPDRLLTRRVAAALDRWGIVPDDSAGQPLQLTPPGRFLRHVAGLCGQKLTVESLFVLLKHPLTATGADRGNHLRFTRDLELHLRRHGPAFPDASALNTWAEGREPERILWAAWIGARLSGLDALHEMPLTDWVAVQTTLAEDLAAGPGGSVGASGLWNKDGGREALRVIEDLRREAAHGGRYTAAQYADLLSGLLQGGTVRQVQAAHPLISIQGTLEVRGQGADLVILAGLNEGSWPEPAKPDPWLSRKMRLDSGLLLPERQIGLSAHDFEQAIAAPCVVLSRAKRSADAECVPSRWMNRLTNLLSGLPEQNGPAALAAMQARGSQWLHLAAALSVPEKVPSAKRPAPRPPVDHRPKTLPVTAIKTLIRDPYAVYAARILRLRPLDPLRPEPDPRLRGTLLHEIVEAFVRARPADEPLDQARTRLLQVTDTVLETEVPWPVAQRLWRARIARIADKFVADEARRAADGTPVVIEKKGSVPLKNLDFTLTATPDRIDLLSDGRAQIYDYKSGTPPTPKEMAAFDKQLYLEAAMAERGGFEALGARPVRGMSYLRLGGAGEVATHFADPDTLAATWTGLGRLIARYFKAETGYTARRALQRTEDRSDYDHLSRFGEWEMTARPEPEDIG